MPRWPHPFSQIAESLVSHQWHLFLNMQLETQGWPSRTPSYLRATKGATSFQAQLLALLCTALKRSRLLPLGHGKQSEMQTALGLDQLLNISHMKAFAAFHAGCFYMKQAQAVCKENWAQLAPPLLRAVRTEAAKHCLTVTN